MRLEYLKNTNANGGDLIRAYDFDIVEAIKFKELICMLPKIGTIDLESCDFIAPVNHLKLKLVAGMIDLGIERNGSAESLEFICSLTNKSWQNASHLLEPFCDDPNAYDGKHFQWLYNLTNKTEFLFSPSGCW